MNATHSKELQKIQKFYEEVETYLNKDINLISKLIQREILAMIKSIEVCKLCKSCSKIILNYPASTLIEEIYTEYELSSMNNPPIGMKNPFNKAADQSKPIRSANKFAENPQTSKTRESPPEKEVKKPPPKETKLGENTNERSETTTKENLFNITKNGPFIKTPHILRSRGKKMSLNQGDTMANNSDVLNREKSAENTHERASSHQRPFTRQVPPTSSKERATSEKPAEEKLSENDIYRKQIMLKVNSIKDQRFKELDSNSSVFEKRTRDLITKIIDCKYWIPITFLLRLTYEQIEKNFPIEDAIDKNLSNGDLSPFIEELKTAVESGKTLFSKSPYSYVTK